jgi:hypothetical protein
MGNLKISRRYEQKVPIWIYQKGIRGGKEDYIFIVGGGRYKEEFTGETRLLITGNYASSFGQFYDQFVEVLNKFPKAYFKLRDIRFLKTSVDILRKNKIKALVSEHNASFSRLEKRI